MRVTGGKLAGSLGEVSAVRDISVVVAHADCIVGEALALLVSAQDDMRMVGLCGDAGEISASVREWEPDVLLVGSDEWSGVLPAVLTEVGAESPATRAIVFGKVGPHQSLRCLARSRVAACLFNTEDWAEVLFAVRTVAANPNRQLILAPSLIANGFFGGDEIPLTAQEKNILVLAARGLGNKQIASRMHLAEGTVKRHLHSVYHKLEATSRSDAVRSALGHGWIDVHDITRD
jgi:DNA-binding NarL/FixJ family response regulator